MALIFVVYLFLKFIPFLDFAAIEAAKDKIRDSILASKFIFVDVFHLILFVQSLFEWPF